MSKRIRIQMLAMAVLFLFGINASAQVQLKMQEDFMTAIMGINNAGHGITLDGYYDFETNAVSPSEEGVWSTSAITNDETILGQIENSSGDIVAAVRINGVWEALPASAELTEEDQLLDISENGIWIVGQKAWTPELGARGFIYNTQTEEFRLLDSELYEASKAYGVNNEGYAVGWVDDLDWQTFTMPAVFTPDGEIITASEEMGELSEINNNGIASGYMNGDAILYDVATGSITVVPNNPDLFWNITFTDVSENGVAVGYGETPSFSRLPLIYHPSLGGDYILLKDFLEDFDIDTTEFGGTAYKISRDGNYIAGFSIGPAVMAMGWAIYLDDYFEGGENGEDCDQGDDSNDMDGGVNITAGGTWRNADDFFVSAGNSLNILQIELNVISPDPISTMTFNFYEDNNGSPGALMPAYTQSNIAVETVVIGNPAGYNLYAVFADVDLTFSEGHYWMQPEAHAAEAYWEITAIGSLGEPIHTSEAEGPWEAEAEAEHGVFKLYCEPVDLPETPDCMLYIDTAEPITRVIMANVNNPSDPNSTATYEDFTDIEIEVEAGGSYEVALEGNTEGAFTNFFTVFIDISTDGHEWSEYLMYEIGTIEDSDGTDGKQAIGTVEIPGDLDDGTYTLRVIKNYFPSPTEPCGSYTWGQAEDYTLVVGEGGTDGDECDVDYPTTWTEGLGNLQVLVIANDFEIEEGTEMNISKVIIPVFADIGEGTLEFYEDNNGQPGTSFAGPYTLTPEKELVGNEFGINTYLMKFELPENVVTGPGIYWVSLTTTTGTEGPDNFWAEANEHTNALANYSNDGGETWIENTRDQDGAFTVEGHCETLGIGDLSGFDFSYYPNPVRDRLYINSAKKVEDVRVFNLTGQEIISDSKAGNEQIDVNALPTGVYVFRVVLEGGQVETFKIIKK